MRYLIQILLLLILMIGTKAEAATLNVINGQLTGASNVLVDGTNYNVEFWDGSCISLFDGCNELSDFKFQSQSAAELASKALRDQVLINSTDGSFDTKPDRTTGCRSSGSACEVITPFLPGTRVGYMSFLNRQGITTGDLILQSSVLRGQNLITNTTQTYAVWTTAVPLPAAGWLLISALGGLFGMRYLRDRRVRA